MDLNSIVPRWILAGVCGGLANARIWWQIDGWVIVLILAATVVLVTVPTTSEETK